MESKKYWKSWVIVALSLAGLVLAYALFRFIKKKSTTSVNPNQVDPNNEFIVNNEQDADTVIIENYEVINETLKTEGFEDQNLRDMIAAQAMHETGEFTSAIFDSNNNYFGMNQPHQRQTLSTGETNGFATYQSPIDCVKDYAIYWRAKELPYSFPNVDAFVKSLYDKGYFTDSYLNYKNGVNRNLKLLKSLINN
jgi:hypothetical protein